MRHDDGDGVRRGPVAPQVAAQQLGLAARIEAGGRLVEEDEGGGGAHPGAGERQLLPLAGGQVRAVRHGPAELGVEPRRKARHDLRRTGRLQCGPDGRRVVERAEVAQADSLTGEQLEPAEVLEAGRHPGSPPLRRHLGQVPAAEHDPPGRHRLEPREQGDQRGLARAVVPHDRDRGPPGQPQVDGSQRGSRAARVGERDPFEDEVAARRQPRARLGRPVGFAALAGALVPVRPTGVRVVDQPQIQRDRVERAAQPPEQPAEPGGGADEPRAQQQDEHGLARRARTMDHRPRHDVQAADERGAEEQPPRRDGDRALGPRRLARPARGGERVPVPRRDLVGEPVEPDFAGRCGIGGQGEQGHPAAIGLGAGALGRRDQTGLPPVGRRQREHGQRQQGEQRTSGDQQDQRGHEPGQQVGVLHERGQGAAEFAAPLPHHLGGVQELGVLVVPDVRWRRAQVHQPAVELEAHPMLQHEAYVGRDRGGLVDQHGDHQQEQPAPHRLGPVVRDGAVDHPLEADRLQCRDDVQERGEDQDEQPAPRIHPDRGAEQQPDGGEVLTHGLAYGLTHDGFLRAAGRVRTGRGTSVRTGRRRRRVRRACRTR
ncbi:hypothetical protein GCM10010252_29250 [Streptomyces aureoverticillatus]|nr:hypothetical protein GCM10010252_29250 [Streptomyces aureoverticillatus]